METNMASGSSDLGIDGLAQRSSIVTSQAWLKAHMWMMSLMALGLIGFLPSQPLPIS